MRDDVYFVPLITRALDQPDVRPALRDAFSLIQTLGREPRHQEGYRQFLEFMETVGAASMQVAQRRTALDIIVECDGRAISVCSFDESGMTYKVDQIGPGSYRVKTDTGLLLWEGNVTEGDVLWTEAFPGEHLPIAADTEGRPHRLKRTIRLPEHGLILCLHAGLESGVLEVKMGGAE